MSKLFAAEKAMHYLFIGVAIAVCALAVVLIAKIGWQVSAQGGANSSRPVAETQPYVPEDYAPENYEMPWDKPEASAPAVDSPEKPENTEGRTDGE